MQYEKIEHGIVLILKSGDEIIKSLEKLTKRETIQSGCIRGIGAIRDAELGFYDVQNKKYIKDMFKGHFELITLSGNISYFEGKPVIHCHGVIGDKEHNLYGGHIFQATVTATVEIFVQVSHDRLERKFDDKIGLNLIKLKK